MFERWRTSHFRARSACVGLKEGEEQEAVVEVVLLELLELVLASFKAVGVAKGLRGNWLRMMPGEETVLWVGDGVTGSVGCMGWSGVLGAGDGESMVSIDSFILSNDLSCT